MAVTLKEVGKLIDQVAPLRYQEEWDHSGFHVNLHNKNITGIYLCLDLSVDAIEDAVDMDCNLIIAHHPLLFHPIRSIDLDDYVGGCIAYLIGNGISLYCAHTSVDRAPNGINKWLADTLALKNCKYMADEIIDPFYEVVVHVPLKETDKVRSAMMKSGAGKYGNYTDCTFNVEGKGTFKALKGAQPYIRPSGANAKIQVVSETRISAVCKKSVLSDVLQAVRKAHPYEEPAISVLPTQEPAEAEAGLGIVGNLANEAPARTVLDQLKKALQADSVRVSGDLDKRISRVAVCGGAAGDLIKDAKEKGAQMYITGEIKHNHYAAEKEMILVEAGHFNTEKCFCEVFAHGLQNALDSVNYNIAIYVENSHCPYVNY